MMIDMPVILNLGFNRENKEYLSNIVPKKRLTHALRIEHGLKIAAPRMR